MEKRKKYFYSLSRKIPQYYFKCLTDDSPHGDGGIPVTQIGPIVEWWISGYGSGENIVLGVSTETAHYYLTAPNEEYADIFNKVREKAYLSKVSR